LISPVNKYISQSVSYVLVGHASMPMAEQKQQSNSHAFQTLIRKKLLLNESHPNQKESMHEADKLFGAEHYFIGVFMSLVRRMR
jgi:hypothetical protein